MALNAGDVISGEVDRLSSSGNGMIQVGGKEWNTGPILEEAVGKSVSALILDGTWAFCLSRKYLPADYDKFLTQHVPSDGFPDYIHTLLSQESSNQDILGYTEGDTLTMKVDVVTDSEGIAITEEGIITIPSPAVIPGREYPVTISSINGRFVEAVIDYDRDDYSLSDKAVVEFEIDRTSVAGAIGSYDGYPILLRNEWVEEGMSVRAGIVDFTESHIEAAVDAIPADETVSIGEELTVTVQKAIGQDACMAIDEGIPVYLPGGILETDDEVSVAVTEVTNTHVTARVDALSKERLPEVGDSITVSRAGSTSGVTIIEDHLPIKIIEPPLKPPSADQIYIEGIESDHIKGVFDLRGSHPDPPQIGDPITVSVKTFGDEILAKYAGFPVVIPNSNRLSPAVREFTVGVEKTEPDRLFASVEGLAERDRPLIEDILDIEVIGRTQYGASAIFDEIPVFVPGNEAEEGEELRVSVTGIRKDRVVASIKNLPNDQKLPEGKRIRIPEGMSISPPLTTTDLGLEFPAPLRFPGYPWKSRPTTTTRGQDH